MQSFLDSLDAFQLPTNLLMREKSKNSTKSGKFFTLICVIYVCVSFSESDLVGSTNPIIYRQDMKIEKRSNFNFTKEDLSLVVGMSDTNNNFELNDKIFMIKSYYIYYNAKENIETKKEIKLNPCQETDFDDPLTFQKLNLNK